MWACSTPGWPGRGASSGRPASASTTRPASLRVTNRLETRMRRSEAEHPEVEQHVV
jgi:hypothetical protein